MKRNILYYYICSLLVFTCLLGCKSDDSQLISGEGKLLLQVKLENNISAVVTRSENTEVPDINVEELDKNCKIYIRNKKGLVRKYENKNEVPSELWLAAGEYTVAAIAGDSVSAGFNTPYYKGESTIILTSGEVVTTNVQCKLANVLASVNFLNKLDAEFSQYKVKLFTTQGTLEFTSSNPDAVGYFMMPSNSTQLGWLFEAVRKDGNPYTKTGIVENVQSCTQYILAFTMGEDTSADGAALIKLIVEEQPLREEEHSVSFYQRPDILGNNFDITQPIFLEVGAGSETSVWINTSSQLTNLVIESEYLQTLGLEPTYDLVRASASAIDTLTEKGIFFRSKYDADNNQTTAKLTFSETLVKSFSDGEHVFRITATDENEKNNTANLTYTISNAQVVTTSFSDAYTWTNRTRLVGRKVKEISGELKFRYREQGTEPWIISTTPIVESNNEFYTDITGLTPGRTYEYQAMAGDFASNITMTFTTEFERQLENSGFENWYKAGKVWLVYGENESKFWDTGNHGSSTMDKNVTNYVETGVHGGSKSIELKSQFVGVGGIIGKFAAGNLFAGEYVRTDGTDGVLSFGRPFTSRPSVLKGFYKYISQPVKYTSLDYVAKNTPDQGIIYVALGDWDEPVEIRTKASERKLFDVNDPHIIAYGELVQETNINDWTEFNIPLVYRNTDRKPKYIVVVASASRYGDYFTGGEGSTLWLDDFELLYNNK